MLIDHPQLAKNTSISSRDQNLAMRRPASATVAAAVLQLAIFLLLFSTPAVLGRRICWPIDQHRSSHYHDPARSRTEETGPARPNAYQERTYGGRPRGPPDTLQIAGSSLPDCSHACGSCYPCRLVMVSFVCASLEEAETCPMSYRCMCNSKSYPVP